MLYFVLQGRTAELEGEAGGTAGDSAVRTHFKKSVLDESVVVHSVHEIFMNLDWIR